MGRTLGNILTIGAAIAINVIPGIGQAISGAIVGLGGGTFAAYGVAAGVVSALTTGLTVAGISAAASLVGLTGGGGVKPETSETAIKTSRPPRVSAYGRSRLYGAYILYETASNGTSADVYAVHDGRMDGIETRYVGDDIVTLTGFELNEGADGRYRSGTVNFYTTDGSVPGAGLPAVTALVPEWSGRGDGVVLLGLTAKSVKAKYFQETYPQSSVPVPSLVARWQHCPDPAALDPLDESGWTWTESPVRHLLHYKLVREGPRPTMPRSDPAYAAALLAMRAEWWGRKIAPTLQYWIDAAADCDSAVALKAGGTEPRYRSAVAHKHTEQHKGPVDALLSTFDGWLATRGDGALIIYSGRYYEPDPADLIGSDEIISCTWETGGVDDDTAINELVCSYISAAHDYNVVECDAWRDEADISARGKLLSQPQDAQVPSHGQQRRLAKRRAARANMPDRGTVTTTIAGRKVRGKRYIPLHLEEAGKVFFTGVAEITSLTRNLRGGVTFTWVKADANVDAWNPATEEGEPAALGARVAPAPLAAPVIAGLTATVEPDGVRVTIEVEAPDRDDLTWFVHWRVAGATLWGPDETHADADPGADVTLVTGVVPADEEIEIEVAYSVGDGRVSAWSATETIETTTETVEYDGGGA